MDYLCKFVNLEKTAILLQLLLKVSYLTLCHSSFAVIIFHSFHQLFLPCLSEKNMFLFCMPEFSGHYSKYVPHTLHSLNSLSYSIIPERSYLVWRLPFGGLWEWSMGNLLPKARFLWTSSALLWLDTSDSRHLFPLFIIALMSVSTSIHKLSHKAFAFKLLAAVLRTFFS